MPIPLINSIASWFLKKRMHQIELFIKYPNEVQNDILLNLVKSAKETFIPRKLSGLQNQVGRQMLKVNSFQ